MIARVNLLRSSVTFGLRYAHALNCPRRGVEVRVTYENPDPCDCGGFPCKLAKFGGNVADMGNAPIAFKWDSRARRYVPVYKNPSPTALKVAP